MSTKSPGGPQRCRLILQHSLAIQLSKSGHSPEDFWMYDSGYMIFQNFLAANSKCWWNTPLTAATRALKYAGHVSPGMLLVTAEPCALEILRGAYARSVLKPPATYIISSVGDIDDCIITPIAQTQFTPLTEALCDVIMDITGLGQSATIETMKKLLCVRFAHMQQPGDNMIYDTLVQLQQERKIYQTAKGYFIVTPERRRSRSRPPRGNMHRSFDEEYFDDLNKSPHESRTMLMSNAEALNSLYGEISTERDGDITHQCIQTNLADVICGGNPNDKIMYARNCKKRSASFPTPRSLERRHSLRLFGSSKRLQRCVSSRSLSKNALQQQQQQPHQITDSSSSEYHSTDSSSPKKSASLLSRLFRRSGRKKQIDTYSGQFPPAEWFNSKAIHLHSIGTQTVEHDAVSQTFSNSTFYDGSEISQRSMTLPRRHHRRNLSSESTFLISSRDCSPIRRRSPICYGGSLPRSTHSIPGRSPKRTPLNKQIMDEKNRALAKSGDIYKSTISSQVNGNHLEQHTMQPQQRYQPNRTMYSGPSSFESGKASLITSGPSSFDSGNKSLSLSLSRGSGHSSLDSHSSASTVATSSKMPNSPKSSPRHKTIKSNGTSTSKTSTGTNGLKSTSFDEPKHCEGAMQNSNSNNSITLQVTNNSNGGSMLPNTKIFVQNSPVRSVITFENGKMVENSNVFIINNESTINAKGETLANRKTIVSSPASKSTTTSPLKQQNQSSPRKGSLEKQRSVSSGKENYFSENDEIASETGDSLSMISETSPDSSLLPYADDDVEDENMVLVVERPPRSNFDCKFPKIHNDMPMNNRKLSLQIPPPATNGTSNQGVTYNNMLKNHYNEQTNAIISPLLQNNHKLNLFTYEQQTKHGMEQSHNSMGSMGNLKFDKKINSNCDLKNLLLNSNPTINSDSLHNIFHKNIITVGSEPNLTINKYNHVDNKQTFLNCLKITEKPNEKEDNVKTPTQAPLAEATSAPVQGLYNFPSLTDLSFNFTSLHAQKIMKGVSSINSIDTLVELDISKPNNHSNSTNPINSPSSTVCTDFGMV